MIEVISEISVLKNVARRTDLQVHEAVFHFNLYMYLNKLIPKGIAQVLPEFPTGNGKNVRVFVHPHVVFGY